MPLSMKDRQEILQAGKILADIEMHKSIGMLPFALFLHTPLIPYASRQTLPRKLFLGWSRCTTRDGQNFRACECERSTFHLCL